jgi:hypothetical protein
MVHVCKRETSIRSISKDVESCVMRQRTGGCGAANALTLGGRWQSTEKAFARTSHGPSPGCLIGEWFTQVVTADVPRNLSSLQARRLKSIVG